MRYSKDDLRNLLEDVVNELNLSNSMIEKHSQTGTAPAELVRLVLEDKDRQIRAAQATVVNWSQQQKNATSA